MLSELFFFFFKQKTAYEITYGDWSSDVVLFRSAETDLNKMLDSVENRLARTLLVDRLAIFLAGNDPDQPLTLAKSFGISQTSNLDLSFFSAPRPEMEASHLFFENTHMVPRESTSAQQTI